MNTLSSVLADCLAKDSNPTVDNCLKRGRANSPVELGARLLGLAQPSPPTLGVWTNAGVGNGLAGLRGVIPPPNGFENKNEAGRRLGAYDIDNADDLLEARPVIGPAENESSDRGDKATAGVCGLCSRKFARPRSRSLDVARDSGIRVDNGDALASPYFGSGAFDVRGDIPISYCV